MDQFRGRNRTPNDLNAVPGKDPNVEVVIGALTQKYAADVSGVLSGWDRVRIRGTQRRLANERGLMGFLWKVQVQLQEFKEDSMADPGLAGRQHPLPQCPGGDG